MGYDIQVEREEKERQLKQNFNVVLIGVQPGKDVKTITASLAKRFDVDARHFEHLFSGGRKNVKTNQLKEKAERFAKIFRDAGAIIELEPVQEQKQIVPITMKPVAIYQEEKTSKEQRLPLWLASLAVGMITGVVSGYFMFNTFRINIYGLTADEEKLVQMIDSDLKSTEKEIAEANKENEKYGESLVKSMIQSRISILTLTADLLKKKIYAIKFGVNEDITKNSSQPDNNQAAHLEKSMEDQVSVIEQAKSDAVSSGGLVGALNLSRLATEQQTLSMLRLQYYIAKYGLYFVNISSVAPALNNTPNNVTHNTNINLTRDSKESQQEESWKENRAKRIESCKSVSSFALEVMKKRQLEIPMYSILEIARNQENKEVASLFEIIIEQAYSESAMVTHENSIRQQDEFQNKIFKQCYHGN